MFAVIDLHVNCFEFADRATKHKFPSISKYLTFYTVYLTLKWPAGEHLHVYKN